MALIDNVKAYVGTTLSDTIILVSMNNASKRLISMLPKDRLKEYFGKRIPDIESSPYTKASGVDTVFRVIRATKVCQEGEPQLLQQYLDSTSLLKPTAYFPVFVVLPTLIYIIPAPDETDKAIVEYAGADVIDGTTTAYEVPELEMVWLYFSLSDLFILLSKEQKDDYLARITAYQGDIADIYDDLVFPTSYSTALTNYTSALNVSIAYSDPFASDTLGSFEDYLGDNITIPVPVPLDFSDYTTAMADADTVLDTTSGSAGTAGSVDNFVHNDDSEMAQAAVGQAQAEIERAKLALSKINTQIQEYQAEVADYASSVKGKVDGYVGEVQKIQMEIANRRADLEGQIAQGQIDLQEWSAKVKENVDVYQANVNRFAIDAGNTIKEAEIRTTQAQALLGEMNVVLQARIDYLNEAKMYEEMALTSLKAFIQGSMPIMPAQEKENNNDRS